MLQATRRLSFPQLASFRACFLSLLLLLLAGRARPLAAQRLPGTPAPEAAVEAGPGGNAQYRQRRVRAVLVQHQYPDRDAPGQPLLREPLAYYEYDTQGRLTRDYEDEQNDQQPRWNRLIRRTDYYYGPEGELASAEVWDRLDRQHDTTRLGRAWLPNTVTYLPPATGGAGYSMGWSETTGTWELVQRQRRWSRRDTTYLATLNARTGRVQLLHRAYAAGRQQRRLDQLTYSDQGLTSATYAYTATDARGRPSEEGQLDFAQDYARRGLPPLAQPPRPTPAHDELARHQPGQRQPQFRQRYNARGQLTERTAADATIRGVSRYSATGQLLETCSYVAGELWNTTTYTYRPDGLLHSVRRQNALQRRQSGEVVYHYFFR